MRGTPACDRLGIIYNINKQILQPTFKTIKPFVGTMSYKALFDPIYAFLDREEFLQCIQYIMRNQSSILRYPLGSASYFQYCMLMIVLAGLAYEIREGYIDDIIVHGQSEADLLVNLRRVVLERCRRYRITFNPKKSQIG
jgi:hypothetical protein